MDKTPSTETGKNDGTEMGLLDHLGELRLRLLISFASVLVASLLAYTISGEVLDFLFEPYFSHFDTGMLIGTGPAEAFLLKIKISIFCGVIFSSPIIFLQIWLFIAPGLYDHERRMLIPFVVTTTALFFLGITFCHEVAFPFAFEFFKEQYDSIKRVTPAIRVQEHLSLIVQGLLGFGIVFEMPVLAYFLGRFGILNHRMMIEGARYAVVIIFIISAIFTPPDVMTQFLMAIPLLVLYGLSILVVKWAEKKSADNSGN